MLPNALNSNLAKHSSIGSVCQGQLTQSALRVIRSHDKKTLQMSARTLSARQRTFRRAKWEGAYRTCWIGSNVRSSEPVVVEGRVAADAGAADRHRYRNPAGLPRAVVSMHLALCAPRPPAMVLSG